MALPGERFQTLIDIITQAIARNRRLEHHSNTINDAFLEAYNDGDREQMLIWWRTLRQHIDLTIRMPTQEFEDYCKEKNHFEFSGKRNKKNRIQMAARRAMSGQGNTDQRPSITPSEFEEQGYSAEVRDRAIIFLRKLAEAEAKASGWTAAELFTISLWPREVFEETANYMIQEGQLIKVNDEPLTFDIWRDKNPIPTMPR